MMIREPIVAGRFYPKDSDACRKSVQKLLDEAAGYSDPRRKVVGGLVPHAGWAFSGPVAARVFKSLSTRSLQVVVLFGGSHRHRGREAALFARGRWETPLGPIEVDARLAERILGQTNLIIEDPYAHEDEHSLEVQTPFIRHLFPEARMVALMVPSVKTADEIGQAVARTIKAYDYDAVVIGTTDLTHYGPHYGFLPMGAGDKGHQWARENDQRFIDLVRQMKADQLVQEAGQCKNACSSGAAAATVAAAQLLGASEGVLLEHTSSRESRDRSTFDSSDSVGYAGIVFV